MDFVVVPDRAVVGAPARHDAARVVAWSQSCEEHFAAEFRPVLMNFTTVAPPSRCVPVQQHDLTTWPRRAAADRSLRRATGISNAQRPAIRTAPGVSGSRTTRARRAVCSRSAPAAEKTVGTEGNLA